MTGIHLGIAGITKAPEFMLDEDDAKRLGEATAGVLAFYKVKMTAKQEAYSLLFEAAATVYPPMFVSLYMRKKEEWDEKKKSQPPRPAGMGHNGGPPMAASRPAPVQPTNITPLRPAPQGGFDPRHIEIPPG